MKTFFKYIAMIVVVLLTVIYFTFGYGNSAVKEADQYRNKQVAKYCRWVLMHSDQQKCVRQNKRAWDNSDAVRAEIIRAANKYN